MRRIVVSLFDEEMQRIWLSALSSIQLLGKVSRKPVLFGIVIREREIDHEIARMVDDEIRDYPSSRRLCHRTKPPPSPRGIKDNKRQLGLAELFRNHGDRVGFADSLAGKNRDRLGNQIRRDTEVIRFAGNMEIPHSSLPSRTHKWHHDL